MPGMIFYHYKLNYNIERGGLFYAERSVFNVNQLWISYRDASEPNPINYTMAQYAFRIKELKSI